MANISNRVKLWRGTRAKYNTLGTWDYWTEYNVHEADGTWKKYFGTKEVTGGFGELAPVEGILTPGEFGNLDASSKTQGSRWLVGSGSSYYVVEFGPQGGSDPTSVRIEPLGNYSVRVKDRGLKAYELVDGEIYTYDRDIDKELDSGSTNAVENSAITAVILEIEEVFAAAFNDLNTRKADKSDIEDVEDAVENVTNDLANNYYDKDEVDALISGSSATVVNCGSTITSAMTTLATIDGTAITAKIDAVNVVDCGATIDVNDSASTIVANVAGQDITAKVEMQSLTIAGANGLEDGITFDGTTGIEILTLDCGEY